MILGFVSDAHGNSEALARCLDALADAGAARIYFLGDAVGYLPEEAGVFELLESSGAISIRGNHEEMLLGNLDVTEARESVYRIEGARSRITRRERELVEAWPLRREFAEDGIRFLLVHGSPSDPVGGYVYPGTDLASFAALLCDVVVLGQTHRPFVRRSGDVEVINVGSSGMPRDVGNLASCAIYDTAARRAEILRVRFDDERLAARVADRVDPSVIALLKRSEPDPIGRVVDPRASETSTIDSPRMTTEPKISSIIFGWDEVKSLREVVESHLCVLQKLGVSHEVVIIDDGSTDGTGELADELSVEHRAVRVVHHGENRGLGGAYRTAFAEARGTFATFYPADGQFPATLLERFYPLAEDWDLLLGIIPRRRDSMVGAVLGRFERILYRVAFGEMPRLEGVFMVRRRVLEEIELVSRGRAWTLVWELILRAQRQNCRITSVPVVTTPRAHGHSKVNNLRTITANLRELARLRRRLAAKR
jgi:putative phosphoesterase